MSKRFEINPTNDFVLERFIDAPKRLVRDALPRPEHLKEWYMPKPWGALSDCELDVRPGGSFSIDIATGDGQAVPNLGCFVEVVVRGLAVSPRSSPRTRRGGGPGGGWRPAPPRGSPRRWP